MAIKISNLQQISDRYKEKDHLFYDLHLDFTFDGKISELDGTKIEKNDVKIDKDESAIKNSLKNLFNTKPGQRFLFPYYGLDLYQFVFEPITESNARLIGEKIVAAIENFEPRVVVKNCRVESLPDDNEYDVTLIIEMPIFKTVASLNSKLDIRKESFIFIETSRNK